MPKLAVTAYAAEWNARTNSGNIGIQIDGGPFAPVPINDKAEFLIMMMMLSKTGVVFDTVTKDIEISRRPVGS